MARYVRGVGVAQVIAGIKQLCRMIDCFVLAGVKTFSQARYAAHAGGSCFIRSMLRFVSMLRFLWRLAAKRRITYSSLVLRF